MIDHPALIRSRVFRPLRSLQRRVMMAAMSALTTITTSITTEGWVAARV